jgi:hypothetical protein
VRSATRPEDAHRVIVGAIPPVLSALLTSDDVERMRQRLIAAPDIPPRTLTREDWLGAAGVFLLVFLSTCPVVVPFLVLTNVGVAVRLSNLVAILMMFAVGSSLARRRLQLVVDRPRLRGAQVALVAIRGALGGLTAFLYVRTLAASAALDAAGALLRRGGSAG